MKTLVAALAAAALAAPALAQPSQGYDGRGSFAVRNLQAGPGCLIFRPVSEEVIPRPVILWGNATNTMAAIYAPMLSQWASHGFVVAAAMTGSAGSGKEMLACLSFLEAENTRAGSGLRGAIDPARVGAAGHSQGGRGAIMAGRDPRVITTAPIQPYTLGPNYPAGSEAGQHGPMLLLSGGADHVADPAGNQGPVFAGANVPVVWAIQNRAGHATPSTPSSPGNRDYRQATTAWFLYQLANDADAAKMFEGERCGLCTDPDWTLRRKTVD